MSNIHFRFFLILLVTLEVSSHKCGWYNSIKVYHPKVYQLGKQFNQFFIFGLETISLALAIYPNFLGYEFLFGNFALGLALMGLVFWS